ncbi:GNAT family N-acetyltransferase [Paenibacillus paeoniae]|uniref:GNAT family N-acetyltransferase n=1 Tax=Paenibacillus paeoniae TaxID=2292705 RepID=A0A371P7F1_9BACL|nr:GNAT family N-acetyltransferase [Paenibacillus paeoniae]REK71849.1 GNAT family N-acetyltransferase [Paenibacillus paeoniae]
MSKSDIIEKYNREQRIDIVYPGNRREADEYIVRQINSGDEDGYISYSNLTASHADAIIKRELDYFARLGQRFEWKLFDFDEPSDLKERLATHGFEIGDAEALMVLELGSEHPLLTTSIPSSIKAITDDEGIDALMALEESIWQESHHELGERLKRDLRHTSNELMIYGAYDESGRIVSGSWMYMHTGTSFCSFWGGSTLPEFRGKGLYTGLIAVRAQEAWKRGFGLFTVDASPMSRPVLESRGFQCIGYTYPCMSPKL